MSYELELDVEDVEAILQIIERDESSRMGSTLGTGLMMAIMSGPDNYEDSAKMLDRMMDEAKEKVETEKENAIMLRAKLIFLKKKLLSGQMSDYLRKGGE